MAPNITLTIIGSILILVGIIFNAIPKLVNEKIMGQLPKEAVAISALFRVVLGGLAIAIGTIALYGRHLPAEHAGHLLFSMGSGFVIVILTLISGKLRGYGTDVWINEPPLDRDKLYSSWIENHSITKKILITPHTAYYSEQALFECRNNTALNCLNYINGNPVKNRII